ncbi:hypothetical protein ATERTT37_000335 [Aspergillus terreus]
MGEIGSHAEFLKSCHDNRKKAEKYVQFRSALSPENPKARFPGFRQGLKAFKAGQPVQKGAKPLQVDLLMHESMSMVLSDGTKLSPYGKQMGVSILDDFPFRAGVPKDWLSGLQKWEGPDPAFWCAEGYAVINVDTRGAYTSEGDLMIMGHQEAQDGAEFVTWLSQQPWCNGKGVYGLKA